MSLRVTIAWFALLSFVPMASSAERSQRSTDGLQVLYTFERPVDNIIRDLSGHGEPLDLRIEKGQGFRWQGERLLITSSVALQSTQPARKIISAIKQSGELTIEAWIKPADAAQSGPARIVSLSADTGQRNFTLGQDAGKFDVRLRTSSTNTNGIPSVATSGDIVKPELTHVIYTRNLAGTAILYVNGRQIVSQQVDGNLSNWSDEYRLSLVNELTGDRPWRGELHLVALYDKALSPGDVTKNYTAGVPTAIDYAAVLPPASAARIDFVKDVQPIFRQRCFDCHAQGNEEGGLNLGIRRLAMMGGKSGPAIVPGASIASPLIHLVAAVRKNEVMPPEGDRLTADQVGILRAWIDQGAAWPDGTDVLDPRLEQARKHWAFQPLRSVELPAIRDRQWIRTPIDCFILAALESKSLHPAPAASARTLVRRTSFDVIGLPPTPDEIQTHMASTESDPRRHHALVDRLLASPHFGERWARHWLDVARYADSDGQETDRDRPLAYRYRDFVIRALNDDMPFDQFVRWQLAGNEYEPDNPQAVAATGFLTAGPFAGLGDNLLEDERLRNRYNELDDIVSTIGTGILGLTLGCVRCHDHKYDAIPARDYYGILSALQNGDRGEVTLGGSAEKVYAFRDASADPKPGWLFRRGDYYDREKPVQLGFVSIMTRDKSPQDYWNQARQKASVGNSTLQRRAMAEWLTDVQDGAGALVARVIVNRIWQHHFGDALVRTVGDFGVRSEPPSHPELLEWLANDLVQNGWKLKRLHRMILTSATWQQAGRNIDFEPSATAADPDNRLLWRMRPQRLEAEILRDAMLAASGTLNLQAYGPGFKPPISSEAIVARNTKDPYPAKVEDSAAVRRRSVYMFHKRVVPYPLLQAFDKPDAQQSCNRRDPTTVAPQALALLNDQFVRNVSLDFAKRLIDGAGTEPTTWIEQGYLLAIGRPPTDLERAASLEFVTNQIAERTARSPDSSADAIRRIALADLCQAWFSLNEYLYID